ncbi:Mechanosensitive ion channel-domain-containing protein [Rhodocollybia butyracea]|uniref:Mechanosensitive ion channel-domain-containing protein n=1 Tax=Rhodocollybia butyracea TaxID=206335 RepID=A0A9P5QB62_9AGAR|nr:Mechanosensitive ion channel-domain-containing protein [Rhodocollybia butyracea]
MTGSSGSPSPASPTAAGKKPEHIFIDPPPSHFLSTSSLGGPEDVASPPYASTSHLPDQKLFMNSNNPYSTYPPSPAYRSQVNMQEDAKPKVHYDLEPVPVVERDKADLRLPVDNMDSHSSAAADTMSIATDDEDDDKSDYDWSGEDDLVHAEAKFEQKMGVKQKRTGWGFKRIITLLFSSLLGSTLIAGILVAPGILLYFYWYKKDPTSHRKYVVQNVQAWMFWAAANLLLSWYLAVIIDLIPTVATFTVSAVWGHVSEVIKSRVELYNSVKNTIKPVLYAASGWASWVIIFGHIYNLYDTIDSSQSRASYAHRVSQVVEFCFFGVLVVCAQQMLSHAIAFAFHRTAFKERLEEVGTALKVIEQLRNYKPKNHARGSGWGWGAPVLDKATFGFKSGHGPAHSKPGSSPLHDEGTDADNEYDDHTAVGHSRMSTLSSTFGFGKGKKRHSAIPDSVSLEMGILSSPLPESDSQPMIPSTSALFTRSPPNGSGRATPTLHRYPPAPGAGETLFAAAKALKTAILHDARNIRGGQDTDDANEGGITAALGFHNVGSSSEAKHLARSIFLKFRPLSQNRTYLIPSDFYPAFPTTTAALTAFRVFDKDKNGDLSRAELKTTILLVYRERRSLARSMRDVGKALRSLDGILFFFALVILFFISLSVFGVNIESSLSSVYTLGLGASFVFKTSASNAFDAIMFLFVTHPYDTGDRCFIDNEILVVKRMGLFATVFTRVDGTETYYFNSQLSAKFITNVRRSGDMYESVTLQMHWRTPQSKIDTLERSLNNWLATEQNRWFVPSTTVMFQSINFQRYLEVTIGIGHNGTWQDWGLRCARKTAFCAAVNYYTRELGIRCAASPQPVLGFDGVSPASPGGGGGYEADENWAGGVDVLYGEPNSSSGPSGMSPAAAAALGERDIMKENGIKSALGFTPPEGLVGSHLRARKTNSRKAMVGLAGEG